MKNDSALLSLLENFPVPASLKEVNSGRYIFNNVHNARQFGIENPMDLVGLTIHDVNFSQPRWGAQYASAIEKLDFRVRDEKANVRGRHQFLDDSGEAQLEEMVKFPVIGSRGNILGIVTYRHDVTPTLAPIQLYQLNRYFYETSNAIKRVLDYLELGQLFTTKPTDAQFRVFLLKAERFANKEVAKFLGMSNRTVESHFAALRGKVIDGNVARALNQVKSDTACVGNLTHY